MSTTGKNRSILAGLVDPRPVTNPPIAAEPPPRVGDRLSALARVTSGEYEEKTFRRVDPARCRMWSRHNRTYEALTPESCADLLESLRAQGKQEFPAIVRRVSDDPDHEWEVICGARRHWSVSFLRTVEHRPIQFLIDERELSDEEAFRVADLENRARQDICDYERAVDYRQAVDAYYGGVAQRMAERLEVSKTWLSRFLDMAKLPTPVVQAFGDVRLLREYHARELKPLLGEPESAQRVLNAAAALAERQAGRRAAGEPPLDAPKVVASLKAAASSQDRVETSLPAGESRTVKSPAGETLFTVRARGGQRVIFDLRLGAAATNNEFLEALEREIARLRLQP